MNADVFAHWLKLQGHQVFRTHSSYWYDAGPHVFQAFPYHWLINPSKEEINHLMLSHRILALRYSTSIAAPQGMASYHVVLHGNYELGDLRHQARNSIKRGLKNSQIEMITFDRLADEGWLLQNDTLERQGRTSSMSQMVWKAICLSAKDLPGFEAWGAIVSGELAASLLISRVDDTCYVPYALSRTEFLNLYVNNALFYVVNRELLSKPGVKRIFFNLHSLDAPESVDEFKFRMNFMPVPVRQRTVFHPLIAPLVNHFSYMIIKKLQEKFSGNPFLPKAEGMMRFYLQGKRNIEEQNWPNCISALKEFILAE
jgi:hypothetical protein